MMQSPNQSANLNSIQNANSVKMSPQPVYLSTYWKQYHNVPCALLFWIAHVFEWDGVILEGAA